MKENLKNNKGITLVALVITIIILLILATVTIRIVLSEGIIKRAENATTAYNTAQTNELEQLDNAEEKMGQFEPITHWWDLSDAERAELNTLTHDGDATLATNSNHTIGISYSGSPGEGACVFAGNLEKGFVVSYIYLSKDMIEELEKQGRTVEIGKWYVYDPDKGFGSEYKGTCPVSLSDFEGGELHMEDFVKRIINSFN